MTNTKEVENSTEYLKRNNLEMKMLSRISEAHPVDIEFEGLSYTVKDGFRSGRKTILNEVSGKFHSGELTAILGPSGSGKTTLLNLLAGYGPEKSSGYIRINSRSSDYKTFCKLSVYIMQNIILQPLLTVKEAMIISAHLKLESNITLKQKLAIVDEILSVLSLKNCCDTMAEQLSGGESKRLSIALELVNNPPVILLDEPTSGLDSVTMTQCLETLKVLTKQGRTVICSIHQPSASSFMMFDQVYFMAKGMCVYNGSPRNMLSYINSLELTCPTTYSPVDYIMEVVQLNQELVPTLVKNCQNGRNDNWQKSSLVPTKHSDQNKDTVLKVYQDTTKIVSDIVFPTSFWTQFRILLWRMIIQQRRNKISIAIQVVHHLLCGLLFGTIFFNIGSDATKTQYIFGFSACTMVFFVFTYVMVPVLLFPSEVKLLKREYFNRWYGLKAYYLALMLRNLLLMVVLGLVFLGITYLMTSQPMELLRFASFATGSILIAIASEAIGSIVGSLFNVTNGAVVGSGIAAPLIILSVYGIGYMYHEIVLPIRVAMALSYLRFGTSALVVALLNNKEQLECLETFCPYRDVNYFLRVIGMNDMSYTSRMLPLLGYTLFFKLSAYLALKYRLNPKLYFTCRNYIQNLIKRR